MFAELLLRTSSPDWTNATPIRNASQISFTSILNDVGSLNFTVPLGTAQTLGIKQDSVVEVRPNGVSTYHNMWFCVDGEQYSYTADGAILVTFSAKSLASWLNDCVVYPSTWPDIPLRNPDGSLATIIAGFSFQNATAGTIMRTLVARGVERGALDWLDVESFSGTLTSEGYPWIDSITITYANGTPLLQVVQDLATRQMSDFEFVGNALQLYNFGSVRLKKYTPEQLTFRRGSHITEHTRSVSSDETASTVLVIGDELAITEVTNDDLEAEFGRRKEKFLSESGITDVPTLTFLGNATLTSSGHYMIEDTLGLTDTTLQPWKNFKPGDWVWADLDGTLLNLQIKQISASQQDANNYQIGLTLGDFLSDMEQKLQKEIDAITSGTGAIPRYNYYLPPSPPTGVVATPTSYRDSNGNDVSEVTITWIPPTTNVDGSVLRDLSYYEIQYQTNGSTTWTSSNRVYENEDPLAAFISNLAVGVDFTSRVRAVDNRENRSEWADQTNTIGSLPKFQVAPGGLSQPTVTPAIQALKISWDGKFADGTNVDGSIALAQVHMSTTGSGFTPSTATQVGTLAARGTLSISHLDSTLTYYVKFVAVDRSGNVSLVSSTSSPGTSPTLVSNFDVNFNAGDIGSIDTYAQNAQPSAGNLHSIWFATADGNRINRMTAAGTWQTLYIKRGAILNESWNTLSLNGGVSAVGAPYRNPSYFADAPGVVHLDGVAAVPAGTGLIGTLPVGYRPGFSQVSLAWGWDGAATYMETIVINPDGTVNRLVTGTTGSISLSNITFLAEN